MRAILILLGALIALQPLAANARSVNVYTTPDSRQDDWVLEGPAHELGVGFPQTQLITSVNLGPVSFNPCPVDKEAGLNFQIQIQNLTGQDWAAVYYVADPETMLTNVDELLGEVGFSTGLAFKIDSVGFNTPLVSESMIVDNIFQAGEIWEFVIQDYSNSLGGPPEALDSIGIAGASTGWTPSTGSIVAVPEPSTIGLLAAASFVIGGARRFTHRRMYG
ncbi:MAG: PEP-CTERM sorting domain-containing protein [Verrucomicrobia bacterium]|nr:PEP-CTERM sorting domain-containing protein [Verrucomicrobiota bacterium]